MSVVCQLTSRAAAMEKNPPWDYYFDLLEACNNIRSKIDILLASNEWYKQYAQEDLSHFRKPNLDMYNSYMLSNVYSLISGYLKRSAKQTKEKLSILIQNL